MFVCWVYREVSVRLRKQDYEGEGLGMRDKIVVVGLDHVHLMRRT